MSISCPNLFVYGTLRRGSSNQMARNLACEANFLEHGKMRGRLYAVRGYPGLTPSEDSQDWVIGDVYRLRDPEALLTILDEYEGCGPANVPPYEYERVLCTVLLNSGASLQCWVYLYRGRLIEENRIWSGEFVAG